MSESENKQGNLDFTEVINHDMRKFTCWGSVEVVDRQKQIIPIEEVYKVMDIWMARGAPIMINHTHQHVGRGLNWQKQDKNGKPGVLITAELFSHYKNDDEIWENIKNKKYGGMSIGGQSYSEEEGPGGSTALRDLITWEFSLVPRMANQEATIESVNMMAKGEEDLNKFIRQEGDEWCVFDRNDNKIACHPTKEKAINQLRAIEANKNMAEKKVKKEDEAPEEKKPEDANKQDEEQVEEAPEEEKEEKEVLAEIVTKLGKMDERMTAVEKAISGAPADKEDEAPEEEKPEEDNKQDEDEPCDKEGEEEEEEMNKDLKKENKSLKKEVSELKKSLDAKTPKKVIKGLRPAEKPPVNPGKKSKLRNVLKSMAAGKIDGLEATRQMQG